LLSSETGTFGGCFAGFSAMNGHFFTIRDGRQKVCPEKPKLDQYSINNFLPSTAIFVSEEEHINRIHKILADPLESNSIGIEDCPGGRILSSEGKVRIFSVKYIKGLEFESVFFVDLDRIYHQSPDLIDKYLYVGLTRAASFLAVTFNYDFPKKISYIESFFKEGDWSNYAC
jgi:superfamily I DNA/RNA helicase